MYIRHSITIWIRNMGEDVRKTIIGTPLSEMGKHPDFMVAHPTPTIFRPLVEIFEISYFFAKNFEKVYTKTSTRRPTFGRNLPKVVNFGEKKTSRP
jgi:hypothetical protein